jgi:hypothetical protein
MTAQAGERTIVRTSVEVAASPEHAFAVFTSGIDRWWTRAHHVQTGELKEIGVDPHVGGRMWEENDAGEVCTWGRVLTWDPPREFSFSWLIGPTGVCRDLTLSAAASQLPSPRTDQARPSCWCTTSSMRMDPAGSPCATASAAKVAGLSDCANLWPHSEDPVSTDPFILFETRPR